MNITYLPISCVVIGINSERTIAVCLESIKKSTYSNIVEIIYVDGGSKDQSVTIAKGINGIKVIELNLHTPTPGKERNVGWQVARGEWIHFFDSDIVIDKNWFLEAVRYVEERTGAIFGWLKEAYPRKNFFHFVINLDWTNPGNKGNLFGGNVLVRRSVLEEIGGYNEDLIAGEDLELSARIHYYGWYTVGVNMIMCYHDINMRGLMQYFKRAFRAGYGFAEAGTKMLKIGEKVWFLKTICISIKVMFILFLLGVTVLTEFKISGLLALVMIFFPLIKIPYFRKKFKINFKDALIYAIHSSIVLYPQFCAIVVFFLKQLKKVYVA
ncbi:MAG: glycosyltransferase [Omnitrophica bacterium]|nr:glycosyltransferase [Candidatus Omnitrophota bacterium]